MNPKLRSLSRYLLLILCLALIFYLGYFLGLKGQPSSTLLSPRNELEPIHKEPPATFSQKIDFSLFWRTLDLLQKNYFDPEKIDGQKILYGAIDGMVKSLGDPYTAFYTPDENVSFKEGLAGEYEGIGAQLGFKQEQLVIVAPLSGSPAEKEGLRAGDKIIQVDDELTAGWSLSEAVSKIRGEAGTNVVLGIQRDGIQDLQKITIARATVTVPSILLSWVGSDNRIAHLKFLRFGTDTKQSWNEIVQTLQRQKGLEGMIIDVRNNPGGLLEAAVYVASDFVADGAVVLKEDGSGATTQLQVDHAPRLANAKVVILINGGSASASEILAGALRVRLGVKLIGEQSFGKGTIQEALDLNGGAGLHVTAARWLLPDRTWLNEKGLLPDIEVKLTEEDVRVGQDPPLDKAIQELENS